MTFTVANATNCAVFNVFEQEIDIVIDIINYLIERAENSEVQAPETEKHTAQSGKRDAFWDYV